MDASVTGWLDECMNKNRCQGDTSEESASIPVWIQPNYPEYMCLYFKQGRTE